MGRIIKWDPYYEPDDPPIVIFEPPIVIEEGPVKPPVIIIEPTEETFPNNVSHTIPGGEVYLSGNPILIELTCGTLLTHHKLCLKVKCDAIMGREAIEKIAPNRLKKAVFDISGIIDQPVNYEFDYPNLSLMKTYTDFVFMVTIDIGEEYVDAGGNRVTRWANLLTNNLIRVLKGKLEPYEMALLNEAGKTFNTNYIQEGRFLTHLPDYQSVKDRQDIKLWYLTPSDQDVTATLNLTMNTDQGEEIEDSYPALLPGNALIEFTINPYFMGFLAHPGQITRITDVTVVLRSASGEISETRHYVVDRLHYECEFFMFYTNPLGGVDHIRFTGEYTHSLSTESETSYMPVPQGSGTKTPSLSTIYSRGQREWEINSGVKTRSEMLSLRDFFTSRNIWMIDPDRTDKKLIPVYIEAGQYTLYDSLELIQQVEFKIYEAHL